MKLGGTMEFKKIFRDTLEHCYAVMHLKNKEHDFLVVASEENQPCYAYDLDHHFGVVSIHRRIYIR